jgi:hypothetical protein
MSEKFFPFFIGGDTVFFGGSQCPATGERGQVRLDGLLGINGLVSHGDVDVAMAGYYLRDMRW